MNRKINIYWIILVYSFVKTLINVYVPQLYNYVHFGGDVLLVLCLFIFYKHDKFKIQKKDVILIAILTVAQVVAFLYSKTLGMNNKYIYRYFELILGYLVMYICISRVTIARKDVNKIYELLLNVAIVTCAYAMIFQLSGDVIAFRDANKFTMTNVYSSFWGHRNHLGIVMVAGIISCTYFYAQNISKTKMKILFVVFLANLILTFSRTCYLTAAVFIIIYLLINRKQYKKLILLGAIVAIGLVGIYFSVEPVNEFVDTYIIRQKSGLTGRDTLWKEAFELLNVPTAIVGRGTGIDKILLAEDTVGHGVGFHNMYLNYLITGGVIILGFMLNIILDVVRKLYRYLKQDTKIMGCMIGGLIAFLVYPIFEVSSFFTLNLQSTIQTFFCIVLPLLYIQTYKEENEEKK